MRNLIRRLAVRPAGRVELCERCGKVCDQRCRADALPDLARARAATNRLGPR